MEPSGRTRHSARRALAWIVPDSNPGGTVYGLITVGALLAAESKIRDTYAETIGSVAVAILMYWFAHSYSQILGMRLATRKRLGWRVALHTFAHDWAIVKGAGLPLIALIGAWASGATVRGAANAAVWTAVASLVAFELAAGVRSHAGTRELALDAAVGIVMGLGILALRAIVA
ncbi:MAG: hypothetical protein KGJ43_03540 [Acidobacteriota bacterium]|nr:hypothetical protein [Acidobacteriota bacterium]